MDTVSLAFICDDNYVIPTCVAITSALLNKTRETFYKIFIITTKLSEESRQIFCRFNCKDISVYVIKTELGELSELHKFSVKGYCVATPAALLKFRLPELIGESKVLYLDGDVIVRSDLGKLFETDLNGYYAGVVVDSGSIYSKNKIVTKYNNYFNSGVMLLNLNEMRKNNCTALLINNKKLSNDSQLMDQNIFNNVFDGKVKLLSIEYNCLYVNLVRASHKFTIEQLNDRYKCNYCSLVEIEKNAKIIHYSSKDKPWKYYDIPLANEWYIYYLRMCNLYGIDFNKINRTASPMGKSDRQYQEKYRPDIVVSLTTYPARINYVHIPIKEMLEQTVKADHIILWLAKDQFPKLFDDLPQTLTSLIEQGLEIRWCEEDLKSHKKYFYTMQEYPDCIIITIDDDLHYSSYSIEKLLDSYKRFPTAVSALRVHLMIRDKNNTDQIAPYSEWKKEYSAWLNTPSMQLFATSGAGTLFPPYCMSAELFNMQTVINYCLYADDIWLKLAQVMVGTPVVLADLHQCLTYVEGTQDCGLWKDNVIAGKNDEQIGVLLQKYNNTQHNQGASLIDKIFCAAPYPNKSEATRIEKPHSNLYVISNDDELDKIRASKSYKIGRCITFIPRKIRGGIRCYKEHGMSYTMHRITEKFFRLFGKR